MKTEFYHQPVMLQEVLYGLDIKPDGIYVDATFGRGGHSREILERLTADGKLIAIDKDSEAVNEAKKIKNKQFEIEQGSFIQLKKHIETRNLLSKVDGVFVDLGVSSPQLDDASRGFSFMKDGPLDMRMDNNCGLSAAEWIMSVKEEELSRVFKEYGEERYARRIAKAICIARNECPIETTKQLSDIIAKAHPAWEKNKNPATRCFQAIRIFINNELQELQQLLGNLVEILKVGGRMVIISFHSLEDRIVKQFIAKHSRLPELPKSIPIEQLNLKVQLKKIGRAVFATEEELQSNVRARSAVLRIAEKIA